MAIWQYQLNVIPKKSIIEKYGKVPNELFIDHDSWEKYWDSLKGVGHLPEPEFEDAKTINWWTNINLDIQQTIHEIDNHVDRAEWTEENNDFVGWKGDSEIQEDNDAHIAYDPTTQIIEEFQFRTDLRNRENATKFLKGLLDICEQNELLVMNTEGKLFEPNFDIIIDDIKKSNAAEFLKDPEKFLEKIAVENKSKEMVSSERQGFWKKLKAYFK